MRCSGGMSNTSARFVPPHCPRRDCPFHRYSVGWRWIRHGSFSRRTSPQRIPRFRCGHSRHTFSEQSFSNTYWLKRPPRAPAHRLSAAHLLGLARRAPGTTRPGTGAALLAAVPRPRGAASGVGALLPGRGTYATHRPRAAAPAHAGLLKRSQAPPSSAGRGPATFFAAQPSIFGDPAGTVGVVPCGRHPHRRPGMVPKGGSAA